MLEEPFNPYGYDDSEVDYEFTNKGELYRVRSSDVAWYLYELHMPTEHGRYALKNPSLLFEYYGPRSFRVEMAEEALGALERSRAAA